MSSVRGRRGASPADARRGSGRAHPTRPVPTGLRSSLPRRPGQRRTDRRADRRAERRPAVARWRPSFPGRGVLLAGLLLLLALTLAGPLRQYLAGRAELAQLAAEGRALDRRAADLEAQLDRQADPSFVERQARERLAYVLPGDRLVIVVDGEVVEGDAGTLAAAAADPEPRSWYEELMKSVATADDQPHGGGGG